MPDTSKLSTSKSSTKCRARPSEQQKSLARLRKLSYWLDAAITLPILNVRVGYDAIIGLIPGFGDAVMLLPAGYIVYGAYRLGAPPHVLARMVLNVGLEFAVGTVPILGDLFDAAYKANMRNLYLLEQHLGPLHESPRAPPSNRGLLVFLLGVLLTAVGAAALLIWALLWLLRQVQPTGA